MGEGEKLELEIPSGVNIGHGNATLSDLFNIIKKKVEHKLAPCLSAKSQVRSEIHKLNRKNVNTVLDEVSSSDFLSKNVRVRPRSVKNSVDQSDDEETAVRIETRAELDEERKAAKQEAKEKEDLYKRMKRRQTMRRYY